MRHSITMYVTHKISLLLLSILLLASCAGDNVVSNSIIQKRKYTNGYHVWGHGKKQKSAEPTATITYVPNTVIKHTTEDIDVPEQVGLEPEIIPNPPSEINPLKKIKPPIEIKKVMPIPNDSGVLLYPPKTNPYAVMSVVAGTGALIMFLTFMVLISIILAAAAIILAKQGKNQIKHHPEKYTGKGLANFGMTLGFIVLGIMVIAIVAVFAFLL